MSDWLLTLTPRESRGRYRIVSLTSSEVKSSFPYAPQSHIYTNFWNKNLKNIKVWKVKFKLVNQNQPSKWNSWCQGIFFMNFDFKNVCRNEFDDNKEKSCSWSRKRVSHQSGFEALLLRNGHADIVGVNLLVI